MDDGILYSSFAKMPHEVDVEPVLEPTAPLGAHLNGVIPEGP